MFSDISHMVPMSAQSTKEWNLENYTFQNSIFSEILLVLPWSTVDFNASGTALQFWHACNKVSFQCLKKKKCIFFCKYRNKLCSQFLTPWVLYGNLYNQTQPSQKGT
ncbi:hypothetical protein OTU49_017136 [Cherax quadricarinatus]|uniref:Uncharacterized protein n=1 Tax=Cherax quadricarinatus TaxID=27406 RepID=A0AAW0Y3N5_CHEQU